MTWDELREYCLAKPGAWPDEPWGDGVVAKVGPKIFAFLGGGDQPGTPVRRSVGLKCGANREAADEWLLRFPGDASVMRYIGRSGWNNLVVGGAIPDDEIFEAVDESYATVVSKLPKKDRPVALRARLAGTFRLKWTGDPPRRAGVSEPAAGPVVSGSRARRTRTGTPRRR
jgi:predicted DNA-binding protein (MmcQ/YjbR family)